MRLLWLAGLLQLAAQLETRIIATLIGDAANKTNHEDATKATENAADADKPAQHSSSSTLLSSALLSGGVFSFALGDDNKLPTSLEEAVKEVCGLVGSEVSYPLLAKDGESGVSDKAWLRPRALSGRRQDGIRHT